MSRTTSLALRLDKQEFIPTAKTVDAFKWTENYIKSRKKNGYKTTKELYESWEII